MSEQFYRAFEDLHRGTRSMIKERLRVYAPFVTPLADTLVPATALDLGCGRGEWLELLGELGFAARGVDLDDGMLAACRERGLDVRTDDALTALRASADNSLALVSAFHLVEHLPFDLVQQLIAEALRVLQPGGLLVMETPNPENLVVGSSSFYLDPSHVKPLPPKLLAFATDFAGFARHKIVRVQEAAHLHEAGSITLFGVLDGVSADYSVVAQKAGPAPLPGDAAFAENFGLDLHTLAQRYDQQRLAALDQAMARISALETQRQDANSLNTQRFDGINEGLAYLDRRLSEESAAQNQRLGELKAALADGGVRTDAEAPTDESLALRLDRLEQHLALLSERSAPDALSQPMSDAQQRLAPLPPSEQNSALALALALALRRAQEHLAEAEVTLSTLRANAATADAKAATAAQQLAEMEVWARSMEQQLLAMHNSTIWRMTLPLRILGRAARGRSVRKIVRALLRRTVAWLASTQWARRLISPLRRHFPALDARLLRFTAALRRSDPDLSGAGAVMPESAEELANPLPLSARAVLADLQRSLSTK
ncbi:bifunctional 2-polyprenyl-6-hydroxyphenol methylase/3-demethylubiquinol 3-O-methyltransferase UbiG [Massilia sp. CF038]|uniref:class I SAM-dependent methyltransferase n=1 Tax=Massilia sp. CF038 TaxID=1881045 RepID=UPI000912A757|nr:class I SAM-dependent methyltransferase [Massilia sp. CF038]SHG39752.1 O-antigen chain-terminating methyltransferase [Massilia sp. CF038]